MEIDGDGGDLTTVGVSICLVVMVPNDVARLLEDAVTAVVAACFIVVVVPLILG